MTDKAAYFNRHVRLLKPDEYSRVFKKPIRSSDRYLTILAIARVETGAEKVSPELMGLQQSARLGLAISKKNAKRAVDRNRIKRLIRESFRQNREKLPGIDLVVMAKPVTKSAENQQIFQSLEQHWKRLIKDFESQNIQK